MFIHSSQFSDFCDHCFECSNRYISYIYYIYIYFFFLLRFCLILSLGTYSSVSSFLLAVFAPLYLVKEKGPSLEGMALCGTPVPACGCLSNLRGCLSSLIYSQQIPAVRGAPRPVSAPRGRTSFGTWFRVDWNLDFRGQLLKYVHIQVLWGRGCRPCWPPEQAI